MQKRLTVIMVGEERFLTYNKTLIMHHTLLAADVDYQFVNVSDTEVSRIARYCSFLVAYVRLAFVLPPADHDTVCWMSEFKFTLPHAVALSILAKIKGMYLVGGPHTLSGDSAFLTNLEFQREKLTMLQRLRLWIYKKRDALTLARFDAIQSYTPQYLDRISGYFNSENTPRILFPIGRMANLPRIGWKPETPLPRKDLKVVFWGIASGLHGVELLPEVARILLTKGIYISVYIFSPRNSFIETMLEAAHATHTASQFFLDTSTIIRDNYHVVAFADVAISHLISKSAWKADRPLMDALATNKLFETMGLGMPVIVARTSATTEFVNESCCVLTKPADIESIVEQLLRIATGEIDIEKIAANGFEYSRDFYTPEAMAPTILAELLAALRAK